ncbi:hypothetical protein BSLG_003409 [Batrachochytrium salamandrivorans]|nr:hypothetical protein BSLG_003409 [Batrachochytrium salamandrivorans]
MQLSVLLILAASVVYELSAEGIDTPLGDKRGPGHVNAAIQGKAQLVLAPKLELSASIFNHKVEAISISLDAEMGMTFEMCAKLEAEGSSSKAISGSAEATVSVALDISTSVNANLFGSDISLYSSKSLEMFKRCRVVKTNFEKPPKPLQTAA